MPARVVPAPDDVPYDLAIASLVRATSAFTSLARHPTTTLAVAAALPWALALVVVMASRPLMPSGDIAVLGMHATDALHGDTLVGAFSRMPWHHPGPAWLYLLGSGMVVTGHASWAMEAATITFHGACAVAAVVVMTRWLGARAGWVALLATWLLTTSMVSERLWLPWNPMAPLVAGFTVCVIDACAWSRRSLPLLAWAFVLTTVLVQANAGGAVFGVAWVAVALVVLVTRSPPLTVAPRHLVPPAVLGVVLWIPVLVDQIARTGNTGKLIDFFVLGENVGEQERLGWRLGLWWWGGAVRAPFTGMTDFGPPPPQGPSAGAILLTVAAVVGALIALALRLRCGGRTPGRPEAIGVTGAALLLVGAVLVVRIPGDMAFYLVYWIPPISVALGVGIVASSRLLPRAGRAVLLAATSIGALLVVGNVMAAFPVTDAQNYRLVPETWPTVATWLDERDLEGGVLVTIGRVDSWPLAAGLVWAAERHGIDATVEGIWVRPFRATRGATGSERYELLVDLAEGGLVEKALTNGDVEEQLRVGVAGVDYAIALRART